MLKALLDTNQLVSSLLGARGLQRQIMESWRSRAFVLLLAPGQIEEAAEVLIRPKITKKYRIASEDRDALVDLLRAEAILLSDEPAPGVCRDPDDDYRLGCAASGGANHLVTGDDDLLTIRQHADVVILDARAFLAVLSAQEG